MNLKEFERVLDTQTVDPFQKWCHITWFCELENKHQNKSYVFADGFEGHPEVFTCNGELLCGAWLLKSFQQREGQRILSYSRALQRHLCQSFFYLFLLLLLLFLFLCVRGFLWFNLLLLFSYDKWFINNWVLMWHLGAWGHPGSFTFGNQILDRHRFQDWQILASTWHGRDTLKHWMDKMKGREEF